MKHKKRKKGINPSAMRCQYCGGTVVLRSADGIYHENHSHTMLYVCSNYPRCDAYVRTHPGTNIPVGTLANRELRTLRNQAHHYFDQLYLSGLMSKQDAYCMMSKALVMKGKYSSMVTMSVPNALRKRPETASMICEAILEIHVTIPSKIQSKIVVHLLSDPELLYITQYTARRRSTAAGMLR